jgi:hypothetical protein
MTQDVCPSSTTTVIVPTIGRIVHVHMRDGKAYAAIVSDIHQDSPFNISVHVFGPNGVELHYRVPYGLIGSHGIRWSWPRQD